MQKNHFIVNRKASAFDKALVECGVLMFLDESGDMVEGGAVDLDETVYAALFCDEVKNVTLVIDEPGNPTVVSMFWTNEGEFENGKAALSETLPVDMSRQNTKINSYAEALAEKLAAGIQIQVTDAVDNSKMVKCPECGMMNMKGSEYCHDCGAEL